MALPYSLRGPLNKQRFLQEHEITCLAHIVLLPGQTQTCCCGDKDITSDYYVFSFRKNNTDEDTDTFFAGPGCGRKLIEESKIETPPLISFFEGESATSSAMHGHSRNEKEHPLISFSPLNKELYIAISLLFMLWERVNPGPLKTCSEFIIKNPYKDAFTSYVRTLNRAIEATSKKVGTKLTLTEMVSNKAIAIGKKPKIHTFNALKNILSNEFNVDKIWL